MNNPAWLEIVFNETGKQHTPILKEFESYGEVDAFIEGQRSKLSRTFKVDVSVNVIDGRYSFVGVYKTQHNRDSARLFLVLRLHGQLDDTHESERPDGQHDTPSDIESQVMERIRVAVDDLVKRGYSHIDIPSIFANAAYGRMLETGVIRR